jgi:hypothetical protein
MTPIAWQSSSQSVPSNGSMAFRIAGTGAISPGTGKIPSVMTSGLCPGFRLAFSLRARSSGSACP